jgi:GNAT superfamily N-acetyltransferase
LSNESTVRLAIPVEAVEISSLAMRSKAHWGYSDEFMSACREELTYSDAQIDSDNYEFYVCEAEGRITGFYALELLGSTDAELEALFVEPESIGQGFGRVLIEHAKSRAAALGIRQLIIQGDPNAEAFYEALGGVRDGQRESGSIKGRFLPIFRIDL